ncbi:MAG: signal peptide peptidase SppA [Bacillota bacterium]|nr:signal peptide peptidase SppA [Bacillota bacterium]
MNSKRAGIILVTLSVIITLAAVIFSFVRLSGKAAPLAFPGFNRNVAVVYLTGPIAFGQQPSLLGTGSSTEQTLRDLERAEKDRSIRAVVIRINSPGGSAAASQELHAQVQRVKKAGKKVVASFGDIAASGGYYTGVAADKIVADPATITGSIGVIATVPNLQELYRKIGYRETTFKSGPHKDMLSPSRPPTPEEEKIMEGLINDTYEQFVRAVSEGRKLPLEQVRSLADGRIYTGAQARELGLVDELGGLRDAVRLAARLAGIEGEPQVVEYRPPGLLNLLMPFGAWRGFYGWPAEWPDGILSWPLPPPFTTLKY